MLSILLWLVSITLTVIAAFAVKKEIASKCRCLFNFQILPSWLKITYIGLLAIECVFLLILLVLWSSFFGISMISWVQFSNFQLFNIIFNWLGEPLQISLLIAAFILALPWIIIALAILQVGPKCTYNPLLELFQPKHCTLVISLLSMKKCKLVCMHTYIIYIYRRPNNNTTITNRFWW